MKTTASTEGFGKKEPGEMAGSWTGPGGVTAALSSAETAPELAESAVSRLGGAGLSFPWGNMSAPSCLAEKDVIVVP